MAAQSEPDHILVIGAGIIGLQCALTLLEEGQGRYKVSIVAEYMPGDDPGIYASAWAGAQWRSHENSFTEAADWDVQTYRYWEQLVKKGDEVTGVAAVKGQNYWRAPPGSHDPWWSDYVNSYQRVDPAELPSDIALGVRFETFTVEVQVYLAYILQRIKSFGGQIARARLPVHQGLRAAVEAASNALELPAETQFRAVINATGFQSKDLIGDTNLFPIRGQTVQVRGVATYCTTRLGIEESQRVVVMPRPTAGITVIGVTVEPNVASTEVDQARVPELLDAAGPYCSELLTDNGGFDVISVGVGIRPGRKGGARVEVEKIDEIKVVHAYGMAGGGYQNSVGVARKVLKLLSQAISLHGTT